MQTTINYTDPSFSSESLKRLVALIRIRPVTNNDASLVGIAGSAFARRIKDLKDIYHMNIETRKKLYTRKFDGKAVKISEYVLHEQENN